MKALAIISTILLLVFVYLWYDQKSDAEASLAAQQKAEEDAAAARADRAKVEDHLRLVSEKVGWQEGAYTKPDLIDPKALIAEIAQNAVLRVRREFWKSAPGEGTAETAVQLPTVPAELQAKVRQLGELRPKDAPVPPDDDADEAARATYAAEKAEYDRKLQAYEALLAEVVAHPKFSDYQRQFPRGADFTQDRPGDVLDVDFFANEPTGTVQVEHVVKQPGPVLARMRAAFEANQAHLIEQIQALRQEVAEKEKTITFPDEAALGLREQLAREQAAHTADVTRLQAEIQDLTARAEGYRVEASNAQNELARFKEESARAVRTLEAERDALREYQRTTKESADLEIRRNDPDGTVLDANVTLGVSYVDLGQVDRVFPGLKFEVYGVGRGGFRERKGVVLIQRVLDAHYSQASVLSIDDPSRPIVRGDTIHNPFYSATKPIHVYIAGDLRKYPKAIAAARLQRAHVVIDEQIGTQTDYIVVPESLTAAPTTAEPGEEGAEPAAPAVAVTEYDRLRERARTFGATLITERMLEAFLDY
jgi:hypothetical protein